jgi:proteasome lid subunit RPN8/RPN11
VVTANREAWLGEVHAHCEHDYPREACGLVLLGDHGSRVVRAANSAPDPGTRFEIGPEELLRELATAQERGEVLIAIYHSHPDGPAALSPEDRAMATHGGRPLWPGVEWLVLSVVQGRVAAVGRFSPGSAGGAPVDP